MGRGTLLPEETRVWLGVNEDCGRQGCSRIHILSRESDPAKDRPSLLGHHGLDHAGPDIAGDRCHEGLGSCGDRVGYALPHRSHSLESRRNAVIRVGDLTYGVPLPSLPSPISGLVALTMSPHAPRLSSQPPPLGSPQCSRNGVWGVVYLLQD